MHDIVEHLHEEIGQEEKERKRTIVSTSVAKTQSHQGRSCVEAKHTFSCDITLAQMSFEVYSLLANLEKKIFLAILRL